jgi:hypothetical protein
MASSSKARVTELNGSVRKRTLNAEMDLHLDSWAGLVMVNLVFQLK